MHNAAGVSRNGQVNRPRQVRRPAITLQPGAYRDLLTGTNLIVDAIRPTLGPLPRLVALERLKRTEAPEFLDDGASIARRIIEVSPRGSDVGAMLIRHALWQMHQEAGDGATTMGVMYQAILREGVRYATQFGCNAMRLRAGLEKGVRTVKMALEQMCAQLAGKRAMTTIALGMCQGDRAMAEALSEVFDVVGPDSLIVVEGWQKLGLEREYIEGTYWKLSGWLSRLFVTDRAKQSAAFEDAAILISDFDIQEPALLVPVLVNCIRAGIKYLVILARDMSERAIGLLVHNNTLKTIQTLAVRTPEVSDVDRVASIEDIALLTGGKPFYSAAYNSFDAFRIEDLGRARRAWAMESLFGIYEGKCHPSQLHQRIAEIRGMLSLADSEHDRSDLQTRLGRMHGNTAILRVGAIHETEREARKAMAERAVAGLRNAILGGVVPGGGAALLQAQSALQDAPVCPDDERIAHKILARALEEPMRVLANNAGYKPDVVIEKVKSAPPGFGFDARTGQIVDMREAGILDSLTVLQKALDVAVSGAAMALTTDVIIHHREPKESLEP